MRQRSSSAVRTIVGADTTRSLILTQLGDTSLPEGDLVVVASDALPAPAYIATVAHSLVELLSSLNNVTSLGEIAFRISCGDGMRYWRYPPN
jgi:hypothetical protein